jgi:hypothetical protein
MENILQNLLVDPSVRTPNNVKAQLSTDVFEPWDNRP